MLVVQQDYSKMNINALLYLFGRIETFDAMKKEKVFDAIIMKYFETRVENPKFNLYKYIQDSLGYKLDPAKTVAKVMGVELSNGTLNSLPDEHQEAFLAVLIKFIDMIEKQQEKSEGKMSMEWDFTNIPSLLGLLQGIESSNIKNVVLKQKINNLSKRVAASYNKKIEEMKALQVAESEKQGQTSLVKASTALATVSQVEIKKLTIAKSKLTKGDVEKMLKEIALYDADDKKTIIELALKKWDDAILSLPSVEAFKYFRENKVVRRYVNPLTSMRGVMGDMRSHCDTGKELQQLGYANIEELYKDIEEWYMTLEGATAEGCKRYLANLAYTKIGKRGDVEKDCNLERLLTFLNECVLIPALEVLRPYKNKPLEEVAVLKQYFYRKSVNPMDMHVPEIVGINASGQYIINETPNHYNNGNTEVHLSILQYGWAVFYELKRLMFAYDGYYSCYYKGAGATVYYPEYKEEVYELISILNSFKVTGEGLVKLQEKDDGYGSELRKSVMVAVKNFFCNTDITEEIAWDLINTKEKYDALYQFTNDMENCGSYHGHLDYLKELLAVTMDRFDFSKEEDRQLFFGYHIDNYGVQQKITLHGKNKEYPFSVFSKVMDKLAVEAPDVVKVLTEYSSMTGNEKDILEFVAIYFGVKEGGY